MQPQLAKSSLFVARPRPGLKALGQRLQVALECQQLQTGWLRAREKALLLFKKREDGPKTNKLPDMDWAGQECVEHKRQKLKHIIGALSS
jgi:hypothetical protein